MRTRRQELMQWLVTNSVAVRSLRNDLQITLRRIVQPGEPKFCEIIDTFCCDHLFRVGSDKSLESIRNDQEVLFKPMVDTENNDVDRDFLRSFIISMSKGLTGGLIFKDPQALGNNLFTRNPVKWFMGPMKAVVTFAECVQGLGRFLELIPPRTIASTDDHATAYIKHPPAEAAELQDTTKKIEMVLYILREKRVTAELFEEVGLLQLVDLDKAELYKAINNASQLLDKTTKELVSTLDTLLGECELEGEMSLDSINIAVNSLKNRIEQTGQLYKLADEETTVHRKACFKWAFFTILSLVASYFITGGTVAASSACAAGLGVGAISTVVGGCNTWKEWNNVNDSDEVRKLVSKVSKVFRQSWIFLTIALWRHNGFPDDDEKLIEFAQSMAEVFKVEELLTNWGSEGYATEILSNNRAIIAQDIHDIIEAVHKRRDIPTENQSTEDKSAHTASPDHNVQEKAVEEINGQTLSQNDVSGAESELTMHGLDASSVNSETDGSTAGLNGDLDEIRIPSLSESNEWESGTNKSVEFWIPSPCESNGWESGSGESDLDFSGSHTPTEGSNYWDH
ncbi:hypothetical protein FLAG1_11006 [Fusarium langsethiae]|uniref:Uncharacterized protein n=1 Tax=Fusarium langsethiae TaxID=179993 RepID=A0A0M9ENB8_FUSLA|nr:hypothetical protein FLAG1_11006 [Fusarium langsethiae]